MKIYHTKKEIKKHLTDLRAQGISIGFVPTMGALHAGHLSLIEQAQQTCDVVVCSIFVNPTQFTNTEDLEKYPRPIAADISKLENAGCDILFNPDTKEMYAANEHWHLEIGEMEHLLEGKFRPGHYQGVMQVVYKLFDIINPDVAFFGQKDYQQVLVIGKMVKQAQLPVKLVMCPIEREADGLAMSSRNVHLTADDRIHALILSNILNRAKHDFNMGVPIDTILQYAREHLQNEPGIQPEYFELADADTLQPATRDTPKIVALVAAVVGRTRLIDNVIIR